VINTISIVPSLSARVEFALVERAGSMSGMLTNVGKGYRLDPGGERTSLREGEPSILVIHPDLVIFISASIVAEKEYIWRNFKITSNTTCLAVLHTCKTISIEVDDGITMRVR
jgi:hypothetical protein